MADKHRKVIFEPQQIGENDWQIRVYSPGAELQYIAPAFKSKKPRSTSGQQVATARIG